MLKVVVDLLLSPLFFFFFQIVLVLPICCASLGGETGFHFSQNTTDQTHADFFSCQSDTISMPILCGTTTAVHGNWAKTVFIASRNVPFLSKK